MVRATVRSRRRFVGRAAALVAASTLAPHLLGQAIEGDLVRKTIPRSGERLPPVGLGTANVFDVGNDADKRATLARVLQTLVAGGARVIDTASSYGSAEAVVGDLVAAGALRGKVFLATKLEAPDAGELEQSLQRLHTDAVDLLQLHNVRDGRQSLARFVEWKARGLCRYVGITSTYHRDFPAVEEVLRREQPEFLQIDYSIDNREADKRLLPLAAETKTAVLTALPFGRGRLFRAVRGKPLPDWAHEFEARSWAQFFLKYLLGDPRITAVIPGTADPGHMADNLGAAHGHLPDPAMRERMVKYVESL